MADGGGHAANLAVSALAEADLEPAIRHRFAVTDRGIARPEAGRLIDDLRACGPSAAILEIEAALEGLQRCLIGVALNLRPIGLCHLVPGVGDARLKLSVIGEQEKPLAVAVEPPAYHEAQAPEPVVSPVAPEPPAPTDSLLQLLLEVVAESGHTVRVPADFDASALERLLDLLEARA